MTETAAELLAERQRRARAVIDAAMECAPEARRAFVHRACARDDDLRALVQSGLETRGAGDRPPSDAPATAPTDDEPVIPWMIAGRYRRVRELGRGSAAIVWLAHDVIDDRDVAIKLLRTEVAHTVASDRFLEEIRIDTELEHPHLLQILGSGETDGLPYYVTPYIAGGSLRARMDRERQMPVEASLAIVRDVADALTYAHAHGVIHRDVKPENILVDGDHAFVADFGIARALTRASGDRITSTGISVGTPAYMSPEQAAGNRDLDERTDVYSLGCVLYEMLAGVPAFIGPTPESVIAQRFLHSPHPLRVYRATVTPEVDAAVARALAIQPSDRFRTMRAFAKALGGHDAVTAPTLPTLPAQPRWRRGRWLVAGSVVAALAAAAALTRAAYSRADAASSGAASDSARYAVAPVSVSGIGTSAVVARQGMVNALRRWRDITVAEPVDGSAPNRAGRVVTARLSASGDSVELSASVADAKGAVLREVAVRAHAGDSAGASRLYRSVSAALLADGDVSDESTTSASGTNRVGAWRAFTRGRTALGHWDLSAATRELRAALALDPQYAQAQLWLAQGLAWSRPEHPEEWRSDALRAASLSASMSPTDSLFASGVAHLASEDFPAACDAYRRARTREPRSELPWFGIGQCQAMDSAVVRDARSPSGWRFRSSYHSAALAYDSALARTSGAPTFAFDRYLRLLFAESFRVRQGRLASSDTIRFLAHPSIDADTLAFIPYPSAKVAASAPGTLPATFALALSRNADRLGERFQEWVRRAPSSPDALAALAYAQEVRGEFEAREGGGLAALGTLRSAVRASRDTMQRIRLSTNIVRVLLKDERYAAAHAVADSLLAANPNPSQAQADYLAGIAALVGEVGRTERLLAIASSAPDALPHGPYPRAVTTAVARLTANAALGVCDSRLPSLVQDVEQLVDRYVEPERRAAVRTQLLARPLSLAVPCLGPSIAERVLGATGRLGLMQRALARGDRSTVVANFDTLARMRRVDRVGDITLETTYQEAWILLAMRDTAGAQRQLCAPLSALPTLGTRLIRDVPQAASVGRALALCAQVAARRGDAASARHWAQAAAMLWSTADAPLRPMLADMKNLAALH